MRKALDAIGADDLDAARSAAAARAEAERKAGEAKAVLESLAPDGIDPLREALAKIPQLEDDADAPDPRRPKPRWRPPARPMTRPALPATPRRTACRTPARRATRAETALTSLGTA